MVNKSFQDAAFEAIGEQQGAAVRFKDIDGIGRKTADKLKSVIGVNAPKDLAEFTSEELAGEAGISESRARKAIRGGGGDPDRKPRSNTGSVSAAGIKQPFGEFKVEVSDHDQAEATFDTSLKRGQLSEKRHRTREAARADKANRAPITTDKEKWANNKGRLDFPGVDTPTDDPKVKAKDRKHIDPDDTTLDTREGSLFTIDSSQGDGKLGKLKGVFPSSRSPGRQTTNQTVGLVESVFGADIEELDSDDSPGPSTALADVTFFERDKEGFGEELIPAEVEESNKSLFEF